MEAPERVAAHMQRGMSGSGDYAGVIGPASSSLAAEIKTQFCTREGEYHLLPLCEYGRPNRTGYNTQANTPVKVSFIQDKICYNVGRELYIFNYKGVHKAADLSKPIDKKVYKGSYPTCHDFNSTPLVGQSSPSPSPASSTARPITTPTPSQTPTPVAATEHSQSAESDSNATTPSEEENGVTPSIGSPQVSGGSPPSPSSQVATPQAGLQLLVGFSAGQIQIIDPVTKDHLKSKLFNDERLIDKTKVTCLAWVPGSTQLFLVSHLSGQLYLYKSECASGPAAPHYQLFKTGPGYTVYTCRSKQTRNPLFRWLVGEGSLNHFAFSPCATFLATVSQDGFMRCFDYDRMELVGSFRSYFGGLLCVTWSPDSKYILCGGEDDLVTLWSMKEKRIVARGQGHNSWVNCVQFDPYLCSPDGCYRFGSVGQDTQLCLWDMNESDVLKQPKVKKHSSQQNGSATNQQQKHACQNNNSTLSNNPASTVGSKDGSVNSSLNPKEVNGCVTPMAPLGSSLCPRLNQVPMLEPLICKKIAPERLTSLHFREDCIVTACQEGYVCTWARPGSRNSLSEAVSDIQRSNDFGAVSAAYIDTDNASTNR